jgi:hypothetical protein
MRKVGYSYELFPDLPAKLAHFLMRPPEKVIEYTELIHQFERRGVDRIASKVAQKIRMLFQHHHIDTGAG